MMMTPQRRQRHCPDRRAGQCELASPQELSCQLPTCWAERGGCCKENVKYASNGGLLIPRTGGGWGFDAGTAALPGGEGVPMRTVLLRATLAIIAAPGPAATPP